jgi:hypothetical protein
MNSRKSVTATHSATARSTSIWEKTNPNFRKNRYITNNPHWEPQFTQETIIEFTGLSLPSHTPIPYTHHHHILINCQDKLQVAQHTAPRFPNFPRELWKIGDGNTIGDSNLVTLKKNKLYSTINVDHQQGSPPTASNCHPLPTLAHHQRLSPPTTIVAI